MIFHKIFVIFIHIHKLKNLYTFNMLLIIEWFHSRFTYKIILCVISNMLFKCNLVMLRITCMDCIIKVYVVGTVH